MYIYIHIYIYTYNYIVYIYIYNYIVYIHSIYHKMNHRMLMFEKYSCDLWPHDWGNLWPWTTQHRAAELLPGPASCILPSPTPRYIISESMYHDLS